MSRVIVRVTYFTNNLFSLSPYKVSGFLVFYNLTRKVTVLMFTHLLMSIVKTSSSHKSLWDFWTVRVNGEDLIYSFATL